LIVCALVLAALAGPGQAATALPPAAAAQKKLNALPNATDGQILTTIRARLAKSKVAIDRFTVTVQNRVATFEGKTSVVQHKGVATRIARTSGAIAVQNHIQISEEARARSVAALRRTESAPSLPGRALSKRPPTNQAGLSRTTGNDEAAPQPLALARATVIPPGK
jgi:hypothetical protein